MFAARTTRTAVSALRTRTPFINRSFHASAPIMVKVGDSIPDIELMEDSPGNKVSIAKSLTGKGLIIGVPAAFSKILVSFASFYRFRCEIHKCMRHNSLSLLQSFQAPSSLTTNPIPRIEFESESRLLLDLGFTLEKVSIGW